MARLWSMFLRYTSVVITALSAQTYGLAESSSSLNSYMRPVIAPILDAPNPPFIISNPSLSLFSIFFQSAVNQFRRTEDTAVFPVLRNFKIHGVFIV
ncbi:MAG: hypothetical protein FWF26_06200, partial [Treponema sp.]|nr:hypothetical protein [Treponema sp.]